MPELLEGKNRIQALDLLRGVAVLGILFMNIQSFSMIEAAYFNPTAYGDFNGINRFVWLLCRIFADQKFMTLFSLLFGAGLLLMSEKPGLDGNPTARHYRRMSVLLLVGLLHAYFLWYGDILATYALCGMIFYWARNWRPTILFTVGSALLLVPAILFYLPNLFIVHIPEDVWKDIQTDWAPSPEHVAAELAAYRGTFSEQMPYRVWASLQMQTVLILAWSGWRVGGLMLFGMALVKTGVLKAERSPRFYWSLLVLGSTLGLLVEISGIIKLFKGDFSTKLFFASLLHNYWASLFLAAAYLATILLVHIHRFLPKAQEALSAVGRMAFTNYLAQSLICTTLFYGHGFGLFGYIPRWQQFLIALAICALEILWSVWWLRRFQQGPLEWLWRCATYLRCSPNRKPPRPATLEQPPPLAL